MNKITFIQELEKGLKKIGVKDYIDIIKDYEVHFDNELKKGKSEEEIAKELGSIPDILSDFQVDEKPVVVQQRANPATIILNDTFGILGLFTLYMLNLVFISASIICLVLGLYLMTSMDIFSFVPLLVFPFSLFAGLTTLTLSVFLFFVSIQTFESLNEKTRKLINWNLLVIKGEAKELVKVKQSKLISNLTKFSGIILIILIIISYIVGVMITKEAEFWHYWNWFA